MVIRSTHVTPSETRNQASSHHITISKNFQCLTNKSNVKFLTTRSTSIFLQDLISRFPVTILKVIINKQNNRNTYRLQLQLLSLLLLSILLVIIFTTTSRVYLPGPGSGRRPARWMRLRRHTSLQHTNKQASVNVMEGRVKTNDEAP